MILRGLTALAAPAGARGKLSVFYFHRALAEPDPLLPFEPDARMFDRMLGWIASQFRVLDPLEACERLFDGTLPSRPAMITFDDGYRDNYTVALPLLQQHRMQAAFFIATGFLAGGMMFNDRVIEAVRGCSRNSLPWPDAAEPLPLRDLAERRSAIDSILGRIKHLPPAERLERVVELEHAADAGPASTTMMMTPEQVADLHRAGMQLGGHTRTHPILLALDDGAAQAEISGGAQDLAAITGAPLSLFAYPNGRHSADFDDRHLGMVGHAGFRYAFTTHAGGADASMSPFALPRFTPWDRSPARFGVRALRNLLARR